MIPCYEARSGRIGGVLSSLCVFECKGWVGVEVIPCNWVRSYCGEFYHPCVCKLGGGGVGWLSEYLVMGPGRAVSRGVLSSLWDCQRLTPSFCCG